MRSLASCGLTAMMGAITGKGRAVRRAHVQKRTLTPRDTRNAVENVINRIRSWRPCFMECNICGNDKFLDMNGRLAIRCSQCGSLERARVLKLVIDNLNILKPGVRVLHLAPEGGLATYIKERIGEEFYDARDIDIDRYQHVKVSHFDLVEECHNLPSDTFDVIIHNHVMEHLPCNVWAVLYHLHRSLTPTGRHIFSIPILRGYYEESLFPIGEEERQRRFAQFDHVRRFGMEDLQRSVGMVFKIPDTYDITSTFPKEMLDRYNVPEVARSGWSGHSIFALKKEDLLLR